MIQRAKFTSNTSAIAHLLFLIFEDLSNQRPGGNKSSNIQARQDDRYWAVGFRIRSGKPIALKDAATSMTCANAILCRLKSKT
jgi:hypothetical protein